MKAVFQLIAAALAAAAPVSTLGDTPNVNTAPACRCFANEDQYEAECEEQPGHGAWCCRASHPTDASPRTTTATRARGRSRRAPTTSPTESGAAAAVRGHLPHLATARPMAMGGGLARPGATR